MRSVGRLLLVLVIAGAAACGDNNGGDGNVDGNNPDAPVNPDAPNPDAPPPATFTTYVIDLVENQTAGNTDPRPFTEFSDLDDPDLDNPAAYEPLFP